MNSVLIEIHGNYSSKETNAELNSSNSTIAVVEKN